MEKTESSRYVEETIRTLFDGQKLAVLSTQSSGQPYASLVAFVASDDLKHLFFATPRNTRKYQNILSDSRIAMLIDSRSNLESDIHTAVAVTATGTAAEASEQDRDQGIELYLSKHPGLQDFVRAESSAFVRVTIESYYLVTRFQEVRELHVSP